MSNAINLSAFDEAFASSEVLDGFAEIPDGKYNVLVDKVELAETKAGKPMFKWEFKIASGVLRGQKIWKNSVITEKTLQMLKTDLWRCGLELERVSDLQKEDVRKRLLDIALEVEQKTKGADEQGRPNRNVYINKRLTIQKQTKPSNPTKIAASEEELIIVDPATQLIEPDVFDPSDMPF